MRGDVYRLGRRRTGSIVLALGVAAVLAGGASGTAMAKPTARLAKSTRGAHTTVKPPSVLAHAAGHKIA
jgi:hypothetical protein